MRRTLYIFSLIFFCNNNYTQQISGTLQKWQSLIVTFTGPSTSETATSPNPFLDYRLNVTFTSPSDKKYVVPGYFAGDGNGGGTGNVWRVNFLPDETGTWSYVASFRSGTNVAISLNAGDGTADATIDGASGNFTIATPSGGKGFFAKGKLYTDNYYLRFQDGSYFLKAGADSPESFFGFDGFDNTPNASHHFDNHVSDWKSGDPDWNSGKGKPIIGALNYLSSKGVNSIYFLTMNIGGDAKDTYPYVSIVSYSGSTSNDNLHFDISKLAQWETVMNHAQEKGIMLHVVLGEGEKANKNELDLAKLGTERKLYYREMVARFGYFPAMQWNICEEYDIDLNIGETEAKKWAQYIKDIDPYVHPLAVHNTDVVKTAYKTFLSSTSPFNSTSLQDRSPDQGSEGTPVGDVVEMVRSWGASSGYKKHPVMIDELDNIRPLTDFNKSGETMSMPEARREWIWPAFFSGAAGVEMYMGGSGGYDQNLQDFRLFEDLWEYQTIAREFVETYLPFWEMTPADGLLTGETVIDKNEGDVFKKTGEVYAIYYPQASNTGSLNLSETNNSFEARWFNPRTGGFEGSSFQITGGSNIAIGSPPSSATEDWVLLLKPETGGNAAPVVTLISPENNSVFKLGETILFSANASDPDGTVTKVEYFVDNIEIGEITSSPFELPWTPSSSGVFYIFARATDNGAKSTSSSSVTIQINDTAISASCGRVEAENMSLAGYSIETASFASDGKMVKVTSTTQGASGEATMTFGCSTGLYDINLGYFDENDGNSRYEIKLNGAVIDTFTAGDDLGSALAEEQTRVERTVKTAYSIANGDIISVKSYRDNKELGRFDYIEFTESVTVSAINPTFPEWIVYPNPARDYIVISGISGNATARFINQSGVVFQETINSDAGQHTFSLKGFVPGLYILSVGNHSWSIIINK